MSAAHTSDGPQAETQVIRSVTVVLGLSTLVLLPLTWSSMVAESPYLDPVWQGVAGATVFGFPIALAAVAFRLSRRALRWALGLFAIYFTLAVATFPLAITDGPIPVALSPWPVLITAIGTVPAALSWPPVYAWLLVIVNSVLIAPVRYLASGAVDWVEPLQYAFFTITFAGMFSGLTIIALSSGRALDAAAAAARVTAAGAAAAVAREQEQARLDALVHDEVISTLYYASLGDSALAEPVRRQARAAIDHLARLRNPEPADPSPIAVDDFVSRMRSVVFERSTRFQFDTRGARTSPLPSAVADAIVEATAEAVRNSLEHAGDERGEGRDIRRSATLTLSEQRIRVIITDDGQGFDPGGVPSHRLGIAVSIRGRLDSVPGGSAWIHSKPGTGTRVELEWRPR